MPTEPIRPRKKREPRAVAKLFPRTERGVVCYRVDRMLRSPAKDKMLKAERHITKRELTELAARPEHVRD